MSRIIRFEGDSISSNGFPSTGGYSGYPGTSPPGYVFPYQFEGGQAATYGTNYAIVASTIGRPGDTYPTTNSIYARQSMILAAYVPGKLNILTLLIGTNTNGSQTELDYLFAYHDTMKAAGFVTIGCTILPVGVKPTGWTVRDGLFNTRIREAVGTHIDALCDFCSDAIMGPDDAPQNILLYHDDHTHPQALGLTYMSRCMWPVLETLITSENRNLRLG